jgi:long-chain acyl-CoA synthetase
MVSNTIVCTRQFTSTFCAILRPEMQLPQEVSGPPVTGTITEDWIFKQVADWSERTPDRFAFAVDRADGKLEEYTYQDVLRTSHRLAAGMAAHGVARQDRVGILMENIPQWVFVLLGVMRIGATAVPLSTLLPAGAIANLIAHAGCKLVFTDLPNLEKATTAAVGAGATVVAFGREESEGKVLAWPQLLSEGQPPPPPSNNGDEAALIVYTSGTTGEPKGVQLSVWNLIHEIRGAVEGLAFSKDHRVLSTLPFSHVLPLVANALGPLCAGSGVVFLQNLSPDRITEALRRRRITCFVCVPQFFYLLHRKIFDAVEAQAYIPRTLFRLAFNLARRSKSRALRRWLFKGVRQKLAPDLWLLTSGGAPLDPKVCDDLSVLGYTVTQAYGLTETTAAATITPQNDGASGSVGKPIRGVTIRIDQPGNDGVGEVWIRGPVVMTGYYRNPEQTSEVMEGPWLRSGDLGYIRPDGNLVIAGRSKDVIVLANGKKVYPEELERHYQESPFIKEICIIGLPADGGPAGETLHAVVTPNMEEFRRRGLNAIAEMVRFDLEDLSKGLPAYQHLMSMSIRNESLPRTVTRKLRRFEIRDSEIQRRKESRSRFQAVEEEHDEEALRHGAGAVVASLLRQAKPAAGAVNPSMNLELDFGLDSLARVELFGKAEMQLGTRMDEREAAGVMTVGDLVHALEKAQGAPAQGRNWNEIINAPTDPELARHPVFHRGAFFKIVGYAAIKAVGLAASVLFPLRSRGVENIPRNGPFLICPNHESFLDGPLTVSQLPRAAIDKILILGYSDYWQSTLMRALARFLSVVSIDSNINLVRAMQVGAAGLREGCALLVFPEGSRSIDGRVMEFKKGAAILACGLDVPILPVGIRGAFESWPRGGTFRLHPIEVAFGVPLHPREFTGAADPVAALTDALRNRIRELAGQ